MIPRLYVKLAQSNDIVHPTHFPLLLNLITFRIYNLTDINKSNKDTIYNN